MLAQSEDSGRAVSCGDSRDECRLALRRLLPYSSLSGSFFLGALLGTSYGKHDERHDHGNNDELHR